MMMVFAFIMAILIIARGIWPLRMPCWSRCTLMIASAIFCLKFQIIRLLGGPMFFAPDLPGWFILIMTWGYAVMFMGFFPLAAVSAGEGIYAGYCRLQKKSLPEKYSLWLSRSRLAILMAAVAAGSWGMLNGLADPQIKSLTLEYPDLPPAAENLRLAVVADLHVDAVTRAAKVQRIVDKVNAAHPDLILILGDVADGTVKQRGTDVRPLAQLQARYGIYAVTGNHEYFSGAAQWVDYLRNLNIKVLLNEHVKLLDGLFVAGITDPAARRFPETAEPDLPLALRNIPENASTILLAHRPGTAVQAAGYKQVILQLSGHTHGGMIAGIDRIVGLFNENFIAGLYRINNMDLYVSSGTSIWNGFPIRLGHNSEITLITLQRRRSGHSGSVSGGDAAAQ